MTTPLTAYLKGYHAGLAALGISANPFKRGTEEHDDWCRGYYQGYTVYDGGLPE